MLSRGGTRFIRRILIASNGMAAMKFIKSIKDWCGSTFGDRNRISLCVMCSTDDRENFSKFIDHSDNLICVTGGKSANNYGNVELIVETAVKQTVDVWNYVALTLRPSGLVGDTRLKIRRCLAN